jgi:hypothetical protein
LPPYENARETRPRPLAFQAERRAASRPARNVRSGPDRARSAPQRPALILRPEQAALAQDREDLLDEDIELRRQDRRHQVEAVGGAGDEPVLDAQNGRRLSVISTSVPKASKQMARMFAIDETRRDPEYNSVVGD